MELEEWCVGVDSGWEEHVVSIENANRKIVGERKFPHTGTGIAEMCTWLMETTGCNEPSQLLVAIETTRGAVIETLLERGMLVYAINPKQLDRFRDRFTVAGAKDDRRDARVLASSLRTDRRAFRLLRVDEPIIIKLRAYSRMHDELTGEHVRESNRFRAELLRYYPQFLELDGGDIAHPWLLKLWKMVPSPAVAARVKETTIAKLIIQGRIRRLDAKGVLTTLQQKPLIVAPGTTEAAVAHIEMLVERLALINKQLSKVDKTRALLLDELATPTKEGEQRDVDILRTLPGIGDGVAATLLTEASQPLASRDYPRMRTLCGVAPVTKQSGKHLTVAMRRACNSRLREAVYHWANNAKKYDPKTRADFETLRARGKKNGTALRIIANRLLQVACAMLRNRTPYAAPLAA
jgi:transposase